MRQKSSPDFITLQCLPEDTKQFQTDHTCLTTMTVICFLNFFFSFVSFFPLPPQLYYHTYHPAERPSLTDWIVFYLHCPPCHRPFLHLTVQIHLCSSPSVILCLRFPKPSLLPDLTFLNYATLILRKQNAGWYSHEFLYTLSLSTGLIQLNSS